jgi:hypothetical protein
MTFTNYPGHLVAIFLAAAFAALTFVAFRSSELRASARRRYRWPLMLLQYAVIGLLLAIAWDPATLHTSPVFQRNAVVTFFDTSESMSVADDRDLARMDKAVEKFTAYFHPADSAGPQYRLYGFDRQAYHCGSVELLRRWGPQSNLHGALSLLTRFNQPEAGGASGTGLAGAVIFTDGRADDRNLRSYLPPLDKDVPLLLVGVGSKTPRTDAAIESIFAPARTWIDSTYPVAVTVTGANLSNEPLTIELLHDGRVAESRRITRDQLKRSADRPGAAEATVEFTVPAKDLGTHVVTARVAARNNEVNTANNSRSASVEVTQEQMLQVLLYSQRANFDVGKIRQALAWDKRIELDVRLDAIRDPVLAQRAAGAGHAEFPASKEELHGFDVVILGPCDLGRFTSAQQEALYSFVADRGGGLLLLPGTDVSSLATKRGEQADALLPVILDGQDQRLWPPAPGAIQPSFEAQVGRIFDPKAFADPAGTISPYYNVTRVKPAATTLATVSETPIIAAHRLGRGRVCLLNASKLFTLYREDKQGGLLSDLVCGLAAYLGATPSGGTGVDLFVERSGSDPGRAVFSARVTDKSFEPVSEANVLLSVGNGVVPMQPAGEGRYTAEIELAASDSVVATAQAERNGTFLGERTIAANLPPVHNEMSETDLDEAFLKTLAQKIGARYLHIDDLDGRAAEVFTAKQQIGTTEKIASAWPRWPLLLALCLILSIKWFLRRSAGLV